MITVRYNASITVDGATGYKFGARTAMPPAQGQAFVDYVFKQLDIINGGKLGSAMFAAMRATGKQTTIWSECNSAAVMAAETSQSDRDRFIKPFRAPSAAVLKAYAKLDGNADPATSKWQRAVAQDPYLTELTAILNRAEKGGLARPQVARLMGRTPEYVALLEEGKQRLDDDDYFKLAFYLYPWLTPGAGIDTAIRFDATSNGAHDGKKPQLDSGARVPHVELAHELIHALRMMQGMRIAPSSWGEECMTVGLPPFTTLPFTENKFRVESNIALRGAYGYRQTNAKSEWLDSLARVVEDGGSSRQFPAPDRAATGWKRANPRI